MNAIFKSILSQALKRKASDIHIAAGSLPTLRIDGEIAQIPGSKVPTRKEVYEILYSIMNKFQRSVFEKDLETDFAIQLDRAAYRFRVNAFHSINGPGLVMRVIPMAIQGLEDLGTPEIFKKMSLLSRGLVLIVGPTGSGKSTTLAAMIDYINTHKASHIVTIEDPIEFIHTNKKSIINQREVGSSTKSFARALKSSLREDPDIILVGELRDAETIQLALTAAETGHLVLGTLHTRNASQSISRMIDVFGNEDKPVVRTMLASSISAVISQRLLKRKDGSGRCGAFEIMTAIPSIRNLIREDQIPQIESIIEISKKHGMTLIKDSINRLLEDGIISEEVAEEALHS